MLAVSLDGRLAPPEGGAAQLGGSGDRRLLEESLAWADACHRNRDTAGSSMHLPDPRFTSWLSVVVRAVRPNPLLVVSKNSSFPTDWRFFQQPLQRWLLAPAAADQGFHCWLPLGDCWRERMACLAAFSVQRLVLLGGAQLTADLLADAVDEMQLTPCLNCWGEELGSIRLRTTPRGSGLPWGPHCRIRSLGGTS